MPELPEVETVCQGLRPWLEGRRLASVSANRPDLRGPLPVELPQLAGYRVVTITRRGKTMVWQLAWDGMGAAPMSLAPSVLLHLGMSGQFIINPAVKNRHDHVVFVTDAMNVCVFRDPRRFGSIRLALDEDAYAHAFRALGPEPLDARWGAKDLARALAGRRTVLKSALLDQACVAGLGNIYVSEALFRAKLHPLRQADSVSRAETVRLHAAIQTVLHEAIVAGGSTLRDHHHPTGELGCFQHQFLVYGRAGEPCRLGHDLIVSARVAGRSTFWCPTCQPDVNPHGAHCRGPRLAPHT